MITKELVDFIKAEQTKGKSEEEIKTLLIQNGWNEGDIKEGFEPRVITKEEKDKRLLKRGKIIFFAGLVVFMFPIIFKISMGRLGPNESNIDGFIYFATPFILFGIPMLLASILQFIYGIKLLKIKEDEWAFFNLFSLFCYYFFLIFY